MAPKKRSEPTFSLDTSCLVALTLGWHEHHLPTLAAVEARLDRGLTLKLIPHALIEAYSVLTRLPAPQRLSPKDAYRLLEKNFNRPSESLKTSTYEVVPFMSQRIWPFLKDVAQHAIQGGRTYDAFIIECAIESGVSEFLTLNLKHFMAWSDETLQISSPIATDIS